MFANLAARMCQIVRNGKGREKQTVRTKVCAIVRNGKGRKNDRKEKLKRSRVSPCGRGYVDGQAGTLRTEYIETPRG